MAFWPKLPTVAGGKLLKAFQYEIVQSMGFGLYRSPPDQKLMPAAAGGRKS
jgi:hypothetical protein